MCGRYSFFTPIPDIELTLGVKAVEWAEWQARYNAAPTQMMPVITNEFPDIIQFFRWGLVPKWAKDIGIGSKMINTRAESIVEKPAFRNIFKYRRCLVLADGYYEWQAATEVQQTAKGSKQKITKHPYRIHLPGNEVMLLAGLWDTWRGELNSFSIITCPPNADVAPIHDRMPVILSHKEARLWLSNDLPVEQLLSFLKPAPVGLLHFYPISTLLNKPIFNDASIIAPL
ncbi:MAG TPA: SOS response-associated peptidase [Phnomibacter sp.]|nr:SOS response-associated peptidase [Phnomibacter sp.]